MRVKKVSVTFTRHTIVFEINLFAVGYPEILLKGISFYLGYLISRINLINV